MSRRPADPPVNALSFDLEHWYTATLLRESVSEPVDYVRESTERVLSLLREYDTRATFFVVGEIAAEYPDLVRRVADEGHEIASHGHTHRPLFDLDPTSFETELRRSSAAIERAVGERPIGFRAPNFSVTPETDWAFDVLREAGYRYDSSVFPMRTPMYGVSGAPTRPYRVSPSRPFEEDRGRGVDTGDFLEAPLAVVGDRIRLPVAGGFYARVLPERLLEFGVRRLNSRGRPAVLYFHPWEFNPAVVRDDVPPLRRFVSFHGIEGLPSKLAGLLSSFEFGTVGGLLDREPGVAVGDSGV